MSAKIYNVLFICACNTARSIIAESVLNFWAGDRFTAFSAGTQPGAAIDPVLLEMLTSLGMETGALRPKDWQCFIGPSAPKLDFIVTLCDQAAGEPCPNWPGRPITAHWAMPDPHVMADTPSLRRFAYLDTVRTMETRIRAFMRLKIEKLDEIALANQMAAIAGEGLMASV